MVAQVINTLRLVLGASVLLVVLAFVAQADEPVVTGMVLSGPVWVDNVEKSELRAPYGLAAGQLVQTGEGARVIIKAKSGAYILMDDLSGLKIDAVPELVKGEFLLVPSAEHALSVSVPYVGKQDVDRPMEISIGQEKIIRCDISADEDGPNGENSMDTRRSVCVASLNGHREPLAAYPNRTLSGWLQAFSITADTGFELALAPQENDATGEAGSTGGTGGDDERGGSGESMCLDSVGGGDAAADSISGDASGVEIEHGKAVIRVNVSWEE